MKSLTKSALYGQMSMKCGFVYYSFNMQMNIQKIMHKNIEKKNKIVKMHIEKETKSNRFGLISS